MPVPRIAIVLSHPNQHFCPQYSAWARSEAWEVRVFFASSAGLKGYTDPGYGRHVSWDDIPMEFPHEFLNRGQSLPITAHLDAPELGERLGSFQPDVVLVYGYNQKLQRRALLWASASAVKTLMFSDSELRHRRGVARRLLKRLVLPFWYRKVSGFLTTGDANEDYYAAYGVSAQRMFRSPLPIDRAHLGKQFDMREALREALRAHHRIEKEDFVFGMVGKFVATKRQRDLLTSLALLLRTTTNVRLVLVGSGPLEEDLRRQAQNLPEGSVIFAGFVQPTRLAEWYAAMDVYVHASEIEAHSVAISEAVFMGLPLVISDRCGSYGPTDDLQIGRNGLVYACGDAQGLAGHLRVLAADQGVRARFGRESERIGRWGQELAHGEGLRHSLTGIGVGTSE